MRIVQVIENFFPDSLGGTETYVLNVSREMTIAGHEVFVVAPTEGISRHYEYNGIKVYRYHISRKVDKAEYSMLTPPSSLEAFREELVPLRPDVVHFNTFNRIINIHNLRVAKQLGTKSFLTPHISSIFCPISTLLNHKGERCDGVIGSHRCNYCYLKSNGAGEVQARILSGISALIPCLPKNVKKLMPPCCLLKSNRRKEFEQLSREADGVVALSPWIAETLEANGVTNVRLVGPGINPEFGMSSRRRYDGDDCLRIIFVGRIYPIKALETLAEAIRCIELSKVKLTFACVCGDDSYATEMKRFFKSLPSCDWHENVDQNKLQRLLAENDFLVLPSKSEMSPLVVLEAFACGLPVIGSDIPAISDNVKDGVNGRLFPVGDAHSLGGILRELYSDPKLAAELKKGVTIPRTFKTVAAELLSLYE